MKKNSEHGRSMLELLAVIALMVFLTLGGIYTWQATQEKSQAQTVVQRIVALKLERQANIKSRSNRGPNIRKEKGPYETELIVKNGQGGMNKDYFWIIAKTMNSSLCSRFAQMGNKVQSHKTDDVCASENTVVFYFSKSEAATGTPDRNCPAHAFCGADGSIERCDSGYKIDGEVCALECPANATCEGENITCHGDRYYVGADNHCEDCPKGVGVASCGNGNDLECKDGYYGDACTPCPGEGVSTCDEDGETTSCKTEYYLDDTVCKGCPDYANCNGNSFTCKTGFTPTQTGCTCDAGKYINGNDECLTCPEHANCNSNSFACKTGFTTAQTGCTCDAGKYINGNDECVLCPTTGVASCPTNGFICLAGYYKSGNECSACNGDREYSYQGATSCSICTNGMKPNDGHTDCVSCVNGDICHCTGGQKWYNGQCRTCTDSGSCRIATDTTDSNGCPIKAQSCTVSQVCTTSGSCASSCASNEYNSNGYCCSVGQKRDGSACISCAIDGSEVCGCATGEVWKGSCVVNCPDEHSSTTERSGFQIIGTSCYCKVGYKLNSAATNCIACLVGDNCGCTTGQKWDGTTCVSEEQVCSSVDSNSSTTERSGQQITGTSCYCNTGYKLNDAGTGCTACLVGDDCGCTLGQKWNGTACVSENQVCSSVDSNSSTTERSGFQITGTTCYCNMGYKLNDASTGCIGECTSYRDCSGGHFCDYITQWGDNTGRGICREIERVEEPEGYYSSASGMNWYSAHDFCAATGGYLVEAFSRCTNQERIAAIEAGRGGIGTSSFGINSVGTNIFGRCAGWKITDNPRRLNGTAIIYWANDSLEDYWGGSNPVGLNINPAPYAPGVSSTGKGLASFAVPLCTSTSTSRTCSSDSYYNSAGAGSCEPCGEGATQADSGRRCFCRKEWKWLWSYATGCPSECDNYAEATCGQGYYCKFDPKQGANDEELGVGYCAAISGGKWTSDGKYLIGDKALNWWSAYSWCKGKGKNLVDYDELYAYLNCNGSNCNRTKAENVGLTDTCWTGRRGDRVGGQLDQFYNSSTKLWYTRLFTNEGLSRSHHPLCK